MGYTIEDSGPGWIIFDAASYRVTTEVSTDGTLIYAGIQYGIPADKLAKMPSSSMLDWNGTHADFFGVVTNNDHTKSIALTWTMPSSMISPRALRVLIDRVTNDATSQQALINPTNWQ